MLAAIALLWITLRLDATTPATAIGHGWTLSATGDAAWQPLFVFPDYRSGFEVAGGFQMARTLGHDTEVALVGRTGATYVDNWRRLFEGGVRVTWRPRDVELRAGLRHDDRLSREGALADFRDPTGRIVVGATVLPIRKGRLAAGAAIDYEGGLPGTSRLPSGVSATAVLRYGSRR